MALMQLIAAAAAGISTLVFHSVDQQGASSFQVRMFAEICC
jgi:hypothetical protein